MSFASISDLVAQTRAGALSAREATVAQLERLHESDRRHHCVAWFDDDHALRAADDLDQQYTQRNGPVGVLHGVPITIKDWIDVAVVARLRAAGAVVIAKTVAWGPTPPSDGCALYPLGWLTDRDRQRLRWEHQASCRMVRDHRFQADCGLDPDDRP